ncbi:PREDICTED: uncharacterized N-acetyltransferase ycf52 isoform X2 [Nelumbo nucifera]|nr:PREDICTED: uncharacterized N-acetyltransferase ycf52 isoform X2 [Nelumbo nucifera]
MAISVRGVRAGSTLQICASTGKTQKRERVRPPIFISTNPSHINLVHLRELFSSCNISCHRFPNLNPDGRVEVVDISKLRIALSHSSVVVSVFCKPEFSYGDPPTDGSTIRRLGFVFGQLFERATPVTESNGRLVGFGRAVSDNGLTASIYDVMVVPSLRGLGIGQMIVKKIIRLLTSRGIYDIAALCTEKQR